MKYKVIPCKIWSKNMQNRRLYTPCKIWSIKRAKYEITSCKCRSIKHAGDEFTPTYFWGKEELFE